MRSYFDRHAGDKKAARWGIDSKGYQAWLMWGGDAGRDWVLRTLAKHNPDGFQLEYQQDESKDQSARPRHLRPLEFDSRKSDVCCTGLLKQDRKRAKAGFVSTARALHEEEAEKESQTAADLSELEKNYKINLSELKKAKQADKKQLRSELSEKRKQLKRLRELNQWSYSNQIRDRSWVNVQGNDENDSQAEQLLPDYLKSLWRNRRHEYPYHLSFDKRADLFLKEVGEDSSNVQALIDEEVESDVARLIEEWKQQPAEYDDEVPF